MKNDLFIRDPQDAFNDAVEFGLLSTNPKLPNYAGHYMYMHSDKSGRDFFKNINTRKYITSDARRVTTA
tara:strand:- start:428 stop:634 length:207 start_codon:yes stop_codon:yes gene_type:complete